MTHTDPTAAHLLRGVLLRPDDDTARLVYADRLDDLGQHERAELVRVQCELARLHASGHGSRAAVDCPVLVHTRKHRRPGGQTMPKCDQCDDALDLEVRADALLTAHRRREWFGIRCPVCAGEGGWEDAVAYYRCDHCTGTGFAPYDVRRGFVESVRCRMGDVLRALPTFARSDAAPQYALTDWARGVLAAHPVTRWEITDLDAEPPDRASMMIWLGIEYAKSGGRIADNEPFPACVGRVARRLAGLPEVTQ